MTDTNREFHQAIYWIETFIKDGFIAISKIEGTPGTSGLKLSIKKQNLRTIENFKNTSLRKIAELEKELTDIHRKIFDFGTLPISEFKPKQALSENEKESLRIDSITLAHSQFPELF